MSQPGAPPPGGGWPPGGPPPRPPPGGSPPGGGWPPGGSPPGGPPPGGPGGAPPPGYPRGGGGPIGGYGVGLPPGVDPNAVERGPAMRGGGGQDQFAVISVVFGALSIFTSFCCIGLLFSIPGLALGLVALGRAKEAGQARTLAIVGVITSAVGLVIFVLFQLLPLGISFLSSGGFGP